VCPKAPVPQGFRGSNPLPRTIENVLRVDSEVLAEWVYEKVGHTPSKRVDHTLHRLDLLSKNPVSETPCCRV